MTTAAAAAVLVMMLCVAMELLPVQGDMQLAGRKRGDSARDLMQVKVLVETRALH
jgi:hypothetical protein